MKFVDEKLKKIFERNNINGFIEAYAYLKNTGCFNRLECISNATYYFPENNINDYGLIIFKESKTTNHDIHLSKLEGVEHLSEYIKYTQNIGNAGLKTWEIHEDLYTEKVVINQIELNDYLYITKDYKGIQIKRDESRFDRETDNRVEQFRGVIDGPNIGVIGLATPIRRQMRIPVDYTDNQRITISDLLADRERNTIGEDNDLDDTDLGGIEEERDVLGERDERMDHPDFNEFGQGHDGVSLRPYEDNLVDTEERPTDNSSRYFEYTDPDDLPIWGTTSDVEYTGMMHSVADALGTNLEEVHNMTHNEFREILHRLMNRR